MTYRASRCYSCSKNTGSISPERIGGPLGPCSAYRQVPRSVYFEAGECKKYAPKGEQQQPKAPPKRTRAKSAARKKT